MINSLSVLRLLCPLCPLRPFVLYFTAGTNE